MDKEPVCHKDNDRKCAKLSDRSGGEYGYDTEHGVVGNDLESVRSSRATEALRNSFLYGKRDGRLHNRFNLFPH